MMKPRRMIAMTDELKIKVIKAILRDWYECGCDRTEALEGIVLAIDAVTDMEEALNGE